MRGVLRGTVDPDRLVQRESNKWDTIQSVEEEDDEDRWSIRAQSEVEPSLGEQ